MSGTALNEDTKTRKSDFDVVKTDSLSELFGDLKRMTANGFRNAKSDVVIQRDMQQCIEKT